MTKMFCDACGEEITADTQCAVLYVAGEIMEKIGTDDICDACAAVAQDVDWADVIRGVITRGRRDRVSGL